MVNIGVGKIILGLLLFALIITSVGTLYDSMADNYNMSATDKADLSGITPNTTLYDTSGEIGDKLSDLESEDIEDSLVVGAFESVRLLWQSTGIINSIIHAVVATTGLPVVVAKILFTMFIVVLGFGVIMLVFGRGGS